MTATTTETIESATDIHRVEIINDDGAIIETLEVESGADARKLADELESKSHQRLTARLETRDAIAVWRVDDEHRYEKVGEYTSPTLATVWVDETIADGFYAIALPASVGNPFVGATESTA